MNKKNVYNTRPRDAICKIFSDNRDREFTSHEIIELTHGEIGEATVYRTLKLLSEESVIVKSLAAGQKTASYRLSDDHCGCRFHLHCINCGEIIHMDCCEMKEAEEHILTEHGFLPTDHATVIDGVCRTCRKKENI